MHWYEVRIMIDITVINETYHEITATIHFEQIKCINIFPEALQFEIKEANHTTYIITEWQSHQFCSYSFCISYLKKTCK